MSCSGVNQFLSLSVPSSGDGPILDVSTLSVPKTFFLSGAFLGSFILLGSLDGVKFTPLLSFDGATLPQNMGVLSLKYDVDVILKSVRLRRPAASQSGVVAGVAGQTACNCT